MRAIFLMLLLCLPAQAWAQVRVGASVLPNGLRLVLVPTSDPWVAQSLAVAAGPIDDPPALVGLSHLLHGLMFDGSTYLGRGGARRLVASRGGTHRSGQGLGWTHFTTVMPSSELAVGLWMEGDRLRSLGVPPEVLVRRLAGGGASDPLPPDLGARVMLALARQASGGPAEPGPVDLSSAAVEAARRRLYAPNNAALALLGGFNPRVALGLIERYFGELQRASPPAPRWPTTPRAASPAPSVAPLPGEVWRVWPVSGASAEGFSAARLVVELLAGGEGSLLGEGLRATFDGIASVEAGGAAWRSGGYVYARVVCRGPCERRLLDPIEAALSEVRRQGVPEADLARARARLRTQALAAELSPAGRVEALAREALFENESGGAAATLSALDAATPSTVKEAASRWLGPGMGLVHAAWVEAP